MLRPWLCRLGVGLDGAVSVENVGALGIEPTTNGLKGPQTAQELQTNSNLQKESAAIGPDRCRT